MTWSPPSHISCDKETPGNMVCMTAELIYLRRKRGALSEQVGDGRLLGRGTQGSRPWFAQVPGQPEETAEQGQNIEGISQPFLGQRTFSPLPSSKLAFQKP